MTRRMRLAAAAALSLAGCETAFVGTAPVGRYDLAEVNGRGLPFERAAGACRQRIEAGHFELDAVARRFEMELRAMSSCAGAETIRESGTYLRRGGALSLETDGANPRTLAASQSGGTISLVDRGLGLRFARRR